MNLVPAADICKTEAFLCALFHIEKTTAKHENRHQRGKNEGDIWLLDSSLLPKKKKKKEKKKKENPHIEEADMDQADKNDNTGKRKMKENDNEHENGQHIYYTIKREVDKKE